MRQTRKSGSVGAPSRQRLGATRPAAITRQTLLALAEAHDKHVLHRDVKPANVFLVLKAEGTHVKLLDFGPAKVRSEMATDPGAFPALTQAGTVVGTPAYMAPETVGSVGAVAASDLYALGIVLFEMLASVVNRGKGRGPQRLIMPIRSPSPV
jgi:serine/threonine-protein kinase